MNRTYHCGVLGSSILLALVLMGFLPKAMAQAARKESADIQKTNKQQIVETYGKLPLSFEQNAGQSSGEVEFLSRGPGYTVFLTQHAEAVLALRAAVPQHIPGPAAKLLAAAAEPRPQSAPTGVLRMKLVNAQVAPQAEGLEELPGKANYFIGNDPKKWRTNVPLFAKVKYSDIYPGVDLVYYGNQGELEYDFIVAPGADPHTVTLNFAGHEKLSLDARGGLVLGVEGGEVRLGKPRIYQEIDGSRCEISGGYSFKNKQEVSFETAAYDTSKPLVIDPTLSYSTYLGG